ncbi:MAG: hypothetical protein ACJ79Y_15435 [Myxococcales bacterium]
MLFVSMLPLVPVEPMLPLAPVEPMLPLAPVEPMLPLAVALLSVDRVVPFTVELSVLGFVAAVPAVAWPPSTVPCWVVPVALAVLVSLFELEHAAIRAAAAIAVPT